MKKIPLLLLAFLFATSLCYAGFETDKLGIIEGGVDPEYDTYIQGGDQAGDVTYTLPTALPGGAAFLKSSNTGTWTWDENVYFTTTTGDARYLRLDFENADSVPIGTGFYKVSDTETMFYVNGTHVHTWTVTVAAEYLLLDDGISKILLSDGTSFLLKTP